MVIWLCPSVEVRSSPLVCKKGRLARRANAVHVTTSTLAASQTTSTLQHFNTPTLLYNDGNLINPLRLQLSCLLATAKRSEEHTSELQSRENLVCRLLLEKKK